MSLFYKYIEKMFSLSRSLQQASLRFPCVEERSQSAGMQELSKRVYEKFPYRASQP